MTTQLELAQAIRQPRVKQSVESFVPVAASPVRDVLRNLSRDSAHAAALFLGCGDGSCLLASLAEHHPELFHLTAVLNDHNATMLARAALILLMASELDPNSTKDMQVLWEVWQSSRWKADTWPRTKPFIERLLQGSAPWMQPLQPEDAAALQRVWRWWLQQKPKPSKGRAGHHMEKVQARLKVIQQVSGPRSTTENITNLWLEKEEPSVVKLGSMDTLESALAGTPYSSLDDIVRQELTTWFHTGAWAYGYTGQQASKEHFDNITFLQPGETTWDLLQFANPVTCWGPFSAAELESACMSGSPTGVLARACIARITQLVRGFQQRVGLGAQETVTVRDSSSSSSKVQLEVKLACCDAVQLCFGMPLTSTANRPLSVPPLSASSHQGGKGGKVTSASSPSSPPSDPPQLFDIIETSTLADEVGLLPLLIAAGARLKPGGRLLTSTFRWAMTDTSLEQYLLKKALLMPLTLTPTVLGLRLLTDLTPYRPEGPGSLDACHHVLSWRELVWSSLPTEMRASPLPELQPQVLGGPEGSIAGVLQAVANHCCIRQLSDDWSWGNVPLQRGTPHLLAWLLASMIQRVDMSALLDSGSSNSGSCNSSSEAGDQSSNCTTAGASSSHTPTSAGSVQTNHATAQRVLWALRNKVAAQLPEDYQLSFKAGMDILRSSLQQNAPQDWLPADVPACPGVLQLHIPLQVSPEQLSRQVELRMVLTKRAMSSATSGHSIVSGSAAHCLDVLCVGMQRMNIHLPQDHGLQQQYISAYVECMTDGPCEAREIRPTKCSTVQAPPTLAQVLLPAACPITAALLFPSTTSVVPTSDATTAHLRVESPKEDADGYEAALKLAPLRPGFSLPSGLNMAGVKVTTGDVKPRQGSDAHLAALPRSTSHHVYVKHPNARPVELIVPWPVAVGSGASSAVLTGTDSSGSGIHLEIENEGQLLLRLPKSKVWEMWPGDEHWPGAAVPLDLSKLAPIDDVTLEPLLLHCAVAQINGKFDDLFDRCRGPVHGLSHVLFQMSDWSLLEKDSSPHWHVVEVVHHGDTGLGPDPGSPELVIRAHFPWLMTDAGRPVLPVTVMDVGALGHALAGKVFVSEAEFDATCLAHQPRDIKAVEPEECDLFRRMLLRNASACIPTAAQLKSLPTGERPPWWYCSYLSFMADSGPLPKLYVSGRTSAARSQPASTTGHAGYLLNHMLELQAQFAACSLPAERIPIAIEMEQCLTQPGAQSLPEAVFRKGTRAAVQWATWKHIGSEEEEGDTVQAGGEQCRQHLGVEPNTHSKPVCANCSKQGCKLMKCGKCGAVQYCSRECQVADWKQHKAVCKR